jgi:hypothetical protein
MAAEAAPVIVVTREIQIVKMRIILENEQGGESGADLSLRHAPQNKTPALARRRCHR